MLRSAAGTSFRRIPPNRQVLSSRFREAEESRGAVPFSLSRAPLSGARSFAHWQLAFDATWSAQCPVVLTFHKGSERSACRRTCWPATIPTLLSSIMESSHRFGFMRSLTGPHTQQKRPFATSRKRTLHQRPYLLKIGQTRPGGRGMVQKWSDAYTCAYLQKSGRFHE